MNRLIERHTRIENNGLDVIEVASIITQILIDTEPHLKDIHATPEEIFYTTFKRLK